MVYGPRVLGLVLTGTMDCGTAGLLSIKARGGLAVVQEPSDAAFPAMPASALEHVQVDRVAPLSELSTVVGELVRQPPGQWPEHLPAGLSQMEGQRLGAHADVVCPNCQGVLTESQLAGFQVLRCHVGHSFTLSSMAVEQAESVERALWAAARALEESATLSARMATATHGDLQRRFVDKQQAQARDANVIRHILTSGNVLSTTDVDAILPAGTPAYDPLAEDPSGP
jgi:two-component system chemotaxis response regulator CheB